MKLQDKVAIVTGASRGIGKVIALCLASNGAKLVCIDLNDSDSTVKEIEQAGGTAISIKGNVTKLAEMEKIAQEVIDKFERIDILVNNAGVTRDGLLLTMPEEDFRLVVETNLFGTFNCTRAVAQQMMFQKSGRIINISSVASTKGGRGQTNYAASKAGINGFTRSAAVELASKKVTVNAIAPGVIETEMSQEVVRRAKDIIMDFIPLKRLGKPNDIANMVLFLASDEAAYITGQVLYVDGGFRG
jgi:3-oxoacyl-[acyl-carrier protein] reductase